VIKVFIAIVSVAIVILLGTYLLSGTGLLGGIGGMFVRVLIGFALLFVSIQIAISREHNTSGPSKN
jgi:hypothetical protein